MKSYLGRFAIVIGSLWRAPVLRSLAVAVVLLMPALARADASISISKAVLPYPSAVFPQVWWVPGTPQNYSEASFTITNNGTEYVWGLSVTFASASFSLAGHTCASGLNPGATCTVTIRYTPQGPGESQYSYLRVGLNPLPYLYDVQLYSQVAAATVPGAPTILSGTRTSGELATLSIKLPQSDGHSSITKLRVTASPVNGCGLMSKELVYNAAAGSTFSMIFDQLAPGVYYYFTAAVANAVGWSPESSPATGPL